MNRALDILDSILAAADLEALGRDVEADAPFALSFERVTELLAGSTLILHAGAAQGRLILPSLKPLVQAIDQPARARGRAVILGLGRMGHRLLGACAREIQGEDVLGILLEVDSPRLKEPPAKALVAILDAEPEEVAAGPLTPGEHLRASFLAASGRRGLPPLIEEGIHTHVGKSPSIHLVLGLEDAWLFVLEDLVVGLRELLRGSARGRVFIHLLSRPYPRISARQLQVLQSLERSLSREEVFLVFAHEDVVVGITADFLRLVLTGPELLSELPGEGRRGRLASYGVSPGPARGLDHEPYAAAFAEALRRATPNWVPDDLMLLEQTTEKVFYCDTLAEPPPDVAFRVAPDLTPCQRSSGEVTLCRVQKGLRLEDLRLG